MREEINKAQHQQKRYYNEQTKKNDIRPGDEVLVLLPTSHNKMVMKLITPYVVESEPHRNYTLVKVHSKRKLYPANLLKKTTGERLLQTQTPIILIVTRQS